MQHSGFRYLNSKTPGMRTNTPVDDCFRFITARYFVSWSIATRINAMMPAVHICFFVLFFFIAD